MQSAPAVSITLQDEPGWRAAIALLTLAAPLCVLIWWAWHASTSAYPQSLTRTAMHAVALLVTTGLAASAWALRRAPVRRLSWDGQQWWADLKPAFDHRVPDAALPGQVALQLDLGGWMLLKFRATSPAESRWRPPTYWLAVSERLQHAPWHALRCAVHDSARKATGNSRATEPPYTGVV